MALYAPPSATPSAGIQGGNVAERALGAKVSELAGRRLKIVMPGDQETWIRLASGESDMRLVLLDYLHQHRPVLAPGQECNPQGPMP